MLKLQIFACCLTVIAGAANAQDPDPAEGHDLFAVFCATCHGQDASGTGPMAEILAIETPDLTQLSASNGGVFPVEAVARQIDGRDRALAHGGTMPLFGPFFEGKDVVMRLPSGQMMRTSGAIADLIVFLESLQG